MLGVSDAAPTSLSRVLSPAAALSSHRYRHRQSRQQSTPPAQTPSAQTPRSVCSSAELLSAPSSRRTQLLATEGLVSGAPGAAMDFLTRHALASPASQPAPRSAVGGTAGGADVAHDLARAAETTNGSGVELTPSHPPERDSMLVEGTVEPGGAAAGGTVVETPKSGSSSARLSITLPRA